MPINDARNVTVSRTYAYVSAGKNGIALVNVEQPEHPRLDQTFTAGGQLNDVNDVKIGAVDASVFAYVADGRNGLRILQVISPSDSPESYGFSPRPTPKLIATYRTAGPALAISRGIDRDRAVDESGNQLAVFGRRGARPLNRTEAEKLLSSRRQALHRYGRAAGSAAAARREKFLHQWSDGSRPRGVAISFGSTATPGCATQPSRNL